jgi:hypothetical protein
MIPQVAFECERQNFLNCERFGILSSLLDYITLGVVVSYES